MPNLQRYHLVHYLICVGDFNIILTWTEFNSVNFLLPSMCCKCPSNFVENPQLKIINF